jgi:hypothetical protein
MRWSMCLIWSTPPCGQDISNVSFTKGTVEPSLKCRLKERSRMDLNAFDLWGMAAIGDIFSLGGRLLYHPKGLFGPAPLLPSLLPQRQSVQVLWGWWWTGGVPF